MNVTTPIIRYSPRPMSDYMDIKSKLSPADDSRVDLPEIWNLAFLSHPFERTTLPKDPNFLTYVRRTCQFNLITHKVDLAWQEPDELFLKLLRKPAPWLLRWLQRNPDILFKLPLYLAYGADWFATVCERVRLCGDFAQEPFPEIDDHSDAIALIERVKGI